jgi:hypothetical protein
MIRRPLLNPFATTVLLFAAVFGAAAPSARAQNVTYYACVNKVVGIPRIVSATTVCLSVETKIQWNQT